MEILNLGLISSCSLLLPVLSGSCHASHVKLLNWVKHISASGPLNLLLPQLGITFPTRPEGSDCLFSPAAPSKMLSSLPCLPPQQLLQPPGASASLCICVFLIMSNCMAEWSLSHPSFHAPMCPFPHCPAFAIMLILSLWQLDTKERSQWVVWLKVNPDLHKDKAETYSVSSPVTCRAQASA